MATLTATNLTLADWAKRTDPDGRTPVIAELRARSHSYRSSNRVLACAQPRHPKQQVNDRTG